jgi:soluble lytic murein transglycosylase-like protein
MMYLISTIATKVGISATLLLSICTVETNLRNVNNTTDPHGGSFGICQLNLKTARSIHKYVDRLALQQPQVNIEIAALYLKKLNKKYKNEWHVVAAYNAGKARIENGFYLNQGYVDRVKRVYCRTEVCTNEI